jgi:hypothetical protein
MNKSLHVMLKRLVLSKLKAKFGFKIILICCFPSSDKTFHHYKTAVSTSKLVFLWTLLVVVSTTGINSVNDWDLIPFYIVQDLAYTTVSHHKYQAIPNTFNTNTIQSGL